MDATSLRRVFMQHEPHWSLAESPNIVVHEFPAISYSE